jgi:competence protein ComEA
VRMFSHALADIKEKLLTHTRHLVSHYKIELAFLSVSLMSLIISIALFVVVYVNGMGKEKNNESEAEAGAVVKDDISGNITDGTASIQNEAKTSEQEKESFKNEKIFVDISGSVVNQGVYEFSEGTRLYEVVKQAGGLSKEADKNYYDRNFNLSRLVVDQEKVYIPSMKEVREGEFVNRGAGLSKILGSDVSGEGQGANGMESSVGESGVVGDSALHKLNINSAGQSELEELPGVGEKTAQKIIEGRPYTSVEDLLARKIVGESLYTKIRELVAVE